MRLFTLLRNYIDNAPSASAPRPHTVYNISDNNFALYFSMQTRIHISLVPRLPDLFNVAREKRGSLVKFITCVTSDGTNFHIWHNSKLAKIKATDAKSSSSSISMLQSALNQQAETLQSLFYESKTAICMVTRSCPHPGGTDLDVGTIDLPCKSVFDTR